MIHKKQQKYFFGFVFFFLLFCKIKQKNRVYYPNKFCVYKKKIKREGKKKGVGGGERVSLVMRSRSQ